MLLLRPYNAQDSPPEQRIAWLKTSLVQRLKNPVLEDWRDLHGFLSGPIAVDEPKSLNRPVSTGEYVSFLLLACVN